MFHDRLLEPQWGRDRKGRLSDWPVLVKHVFFFLIYFKNMSYREVEPFSLGEGGHFFYWKWQLLPSSGLKRRRKARNFITDYTVSRPRCGTVRSHGHENLKSNMLVNFFCSFMFVSNLLRSWDWVEPYCHSSSEPSWRVMCDLFVRSEFFLPKLCCRSFTCFELLRRVFGKQLPTFRSKCKSCWTAWPWKWTHFSSLETREIHQMTEGNIPADMSL